MIKSRKWGLAKAAILLTACICCAQFGPRSRDSQKTGDHYIRIEGNTLVNEDTVRTARETVPHSTSMPGWTNAPGFDADVFTFARVLFRSDPYAGPRWGFGRRLGWWVDYPDADLNLSYRLQQLTAIRTDPDCRVLRLTEPDIFDFPLLYMEHAGYMRLDYDEVAALGKYFSGGGSLLVNDFWSTQEWDGFAKQIARVLPNQPWTDLNTEHPIFHCVFDLPAPMHKLRVPTMQFWDEDFDANDPHSRPHRVFRGEGSEEMHVRALLDKSGRIMILAIHNSDVSDGWEREGENDSYFSHYSEKIAYPLAINIIYYFMTH